MPLHQLNLFTQLKIKSHYLLCILAALSLSGCYPWIKHIEVQQGNVVEQQQLDKLKPGISREHVLFLLGNPLVVDQFENDKWFYYFYSRDDTDSRKSFRVTVHFIDDTFTGYEIAGNFFDIEKQRTE